LNISGIVHFIGVILRSSQPAAAEFGPDRRGFSPTEKEEVEEFKEKMEISVTETNVNTSSDVVAALTSDGRDHRYALRGDGC
jgi:hypothetical protein